MNLAGTMLRRLVDLSIRRRLTLALGTLVVCLSLYLLALPVVRLDCPLLLAVAITSWLLFWRGGLVCIGIIVGVVAGGDALRMGAAFWSATHISAFACGIASCLGVWLVIGAGRQLAEHLSTSRQQLMQTQQAYQQEQRLNLAKERSLHAISHELRTSLTQVQGYLDLLEIHQASSDPSSHQDRFIVQAQNGCEEMLALISTILDTASNASQPLHFQTFSVRNEVQAVLDQMDPRVLQGRHLNLDIAGALEVEADQRAVRIVVRNLLTNALKYTSTAVPITIRATPVEDTRSGSAPMVSICVSDEGPGIPPEQQALLFKRFVRLSNALSSGKPGSGLGLAICKHLVEQMGGCIWLESSGEPGQGCSFFFTLKAPDAPVSSSSTFEIQRDVRFTLGCK